MSQEQQTALVFSFLQFLSRNRVEKQEQIDLAIQVLSDAFQIDITDPHLREKYEYIGQDILSITNAGAASLDAKTLEEEKKELEEQPLFHQFLASVSGKYFQGVDPNSNEYYERYVKLVKKFKERNIKSVPENNEEEGERLKNLGNEALKNKDYQSAIDYYTKAIELCPTGSNVHIYYSNRAAVHSLRNDHEMAVNDCEKAISFKPDFSKAYSRLGTAHFHLGNYAKAKEAYLKTLELDPQNAIAHEFLAKSEEKLQLQTSELDEDFSSSFPGGAPRTGGAPQGGGNPLETLLQNPQMMEMAQKFMGQGGAGGAGGAGGMQQLLQNPAMMQMAQQMMQNPQMMQQMMSMLGGAGAQRK